MHRIRKMQGIIGLVGILGLAACGQTVGEQALFGGGAGALAGAATGGDPVTGAVVGAAGNVAYCQLNPGRCR
jgi:osmotically inducible lipoprotein OsmB